MRGFLARTENWNAGWSIIFWRGGAPIANFDLLLIRNELSGLKKTWFFSEHELISQNTAKRIVIIKKNGTKPELAKQKATKILSKWRHSPKSSILLEIVVEAVNKQ